MAYIGRSLDQFSNVQKLDNITFTNSAGPYNLTKSSAAFTPTNAESLLIEVDGILQASDSYTVSGSTITFGASMSSSSTMNNIIHLGIGLLSTPVDNSVTTAKIVDSNVTTAKIADSAVTNAKLAGSISNDKLDSIANSKLTNSSITINGSAVSLGGSVTIGETKPTISSISPTVIENTQTSITITGTNFVNGANVEAVATNGAIVQADTVTFNSATSISAAFTISTDGTYFLRIENPDGNAVRSSTALLTVSDAPAWTTSAGSLGSNAAGSSVSYTVAATGATSFAKTSGTFPGGVSLDTSTGVISGTESGATAETTYSFTITATDAEGQTADRAFSITITVGINNSGQFN